MKRHLIFSLLATSALMGCRKVSFTPMALNESLKLSEPADPGAILVPPMTGGDSPVFKSGVCVDQQSVATCLKCDNPAPPSPVPLPSTKAQKLARIMKMSCQIGNRSYPGDYAPPANADIDARVEACTAELYPETPMSSAQRSTMNKLLDANDPSMRNKFFAGLWYQPPFTDHFEMYFGLEGKEAAAVFCLGQHIQGDLLTTEYINAVSGDYFAWLNDPAAQARWNEAQSLRRQLLSCLDKPAGPAPLPVPLPSQKTCEYKSFEGNFDDGGRDEMFQLLTDGYKLAVETENSCNLWTQVPGAGSVKGRVKIVGYRCQ